METRYSWAPAQASAKEMEAFAKICQVAAHGIQYKENWDALGYSCPNPAKKGFFSSLFSPKDNTPTKSDILKKFLLDTIVVAGLNVIESPCNNLLGRIDWYLKDHKQVLNNEDLEEGLRRHFFYRTYSDVSVEYYMKDAGGVTKREAERLENVLEMIELSYTEVFTEIFSNYKG